MVARGFLNAPTLLTRGQGFGIGVIPAVPPAAFALLLFLGSYSWLGVTLAVACFCSGAVIGSTIGRSLAIRPDPTGVLMVAAIAEAVGGLMAFATVGLIDPSGMLALFVVVVPAYFFVAFPGVVIGIVLARHLGS